MFDKAKFSHSPFNRTTEEAPHFYATVQTSFELLVGVVHVRARLEPVRMDASSAVSVGVLWLKQPLPEVTAGAEFDLDPNFTALLPSQTVSMGMEYAFSASLASLVPLGSILCDTTMAFEATLWARMPLRPVCVNAEHGVYANASVLVPISTAVVGSEFDLRPFLSVRVPFPSTVLSTQFDISTKVIRSEDSEEMVLEGINLAPGSILVIDTDTLDVEVDGVPRVDAWVVGSEFFQFKKGQNILTFSDNARSRRLETTVVWADRYL